MKKHVLGILTFFGVITAFVVDFTPGRKVPGGEVFVVSSPSREYQEIKVPKKFKAYVNSISFDEKSQRFTAQLELEWDGTLPNPNELHVGIGVTTQTNGSSGMGIHRFTVARPFKDGSKQTLEIGWKDPWFTRFYREPNYLAYAEIEPELDGVADLVFRERNYLLNAVPLTVIRKTR